MTPQDWTLLVIAAASGKPVQPVQLQKALFLISRGLNAQQRQTDAFYEFTPYDYGPFSSDVYRDAEALEESGFVKIVRPPETRYREYSVTATGMERAQELRRSLGAPAAGYLQRVVDFVRALSFNALVSAIYKAYPEMRANSVFQE